MGCPCPPAIGGRREVIIWQRLGGSGCGSWTVVSGDPVLTVWASSTGFLISLRPPLCDRQPARTCLCGLGCLTPEVLETGALVLQWGAVPRLKHMRPKLGVVPPPGLQPCPVCSCCVLGVRVMLGFLILFPKSLRYQKPTQQVDHVPHTKPRGPIFAGWGLK